MRSTQTKVRQPEQATAASTETEGGDLQDSLGDPLGAPIQMWQEGPATDALAADRVAPSAGHQLPQDVLGHMETAFDSDFSNVKVTESSAASDLGAKAFTRGDQIVAKPGAMDTSSDSGMALLGHELAHVEQQRGGETGGGVGGQVVESPALEASADAAGAKAAKGMKVDGGGSGGDGDLSGGAPAMMYSEGVPTSTGELRLSDGGKMAVPAGENYPNHQLWADSSVVSSANKQLEAAGSVIELTSGGSAVSFTDPTTKKATTLPGVTAKHRINGTSGDSMKLFADCGRSARDVTGGVGEKWGKMSAKYTKTEEPGPMEVKMAEMLGEEAPTGTSEEKFTGPSGHPKTFKKEMFDDLGLSTGKYDKPTDDQASKAGINEFADPEVGEAFTMLSGGDNFADAPGGKTWNFHWGGVVMKDGGDKLVLENYAVGDAEEQNADWEFAMYGSAKGTTFHDAHLGTKQHGEIPTTMTARPTKSVP